ncbi:TPA: elongation factor EF-2 [Candidatus Woesearchaeota archaeon]|nr:elongation factor EF-2 [Candidatus Woesearchaeota archaeon]HIH31813.1 elongation factor EF-2 [Candidatus Woesearchaeota archaeon]HIH55472.1 elongation factor EF-2 [Candidatus Woesearchaeota archaeon]HIJ01886.1 elongation factor EF-2 [Candidatus Woesearchaeota archaeon]HIJ13787.1 elongation factor EF-2 [Candidatus Woesearchaeota archaeon]
MGEKMVDKVMRIMNRPNNIRNIATCAHIDHGKTTFSDNLLWGAGMMSEELAGKACVLDFHEDEMTRGITIDAANVSMVHEVDGQEFLINLIDTPGHVDFGGDVTRAMRAVDGAITLCCAVEGIMPQTETVLKQALRERVKPILFINKVDRLIKEVKLTPEAMQERFMKIINHVNRLIIDISPDMGPKWQVNVLDGSVCFGSAFHNWALSVPYMKKKEISFKDIIDAYENDAWKELKHKAPLHEVILDAVIKHHPSPIRAQEYRIPKIWHGDLQSPLGQALLKADPKGPGVFVITKIVIDPQAGEIAAGRVFGGTLHRGDMMRLNRAKMDVRVQQLYVYNGPKREIVDNIPAGNIIGAGGLKGAYPGETVSIGEIEPFEQITHIFEPVMTKAIEAKRPSDLPKLVEVLIQISKEDPSIVIEINQETGEHLMSGMGELHLEIIENRIKSEKGVEIVSSPPIVVYRETITRNSPEDYEGKSPNKHNKFYFKVEPLSDELKAAIKSGSISSGRVKKNSQELWQSLEEAGMDSKESRKVRDVYNGNMLIDGTRGIVHIGEVIEMVSDMFEDVMMKGPLSKEPCIGVKVILDDVKLHEDAIHRGPAQVYPAVREGIRGAMMTANPLIFEPVQVLQFDAPVEFMGEISKLISSKRGQLLDMQQEGAQIMVKGKLPVGEMFGLSSDLRSATEGRGNFFVLDQTFEKLPEELQMKIITQIRNRKGLKGTEEEASE